MTIEELLAELEMEAQTTRRVLERVPAEHLGWRPHERSLTMGQLAMHVASIPGALTEISTRTFDVRTTIPRPGAATTGELLERLEQSLAEARELLVSMDDAALSLPWLLVDGDRPVTSVPRAVFLRHTMLNHWYHHRGQLTVYLRQVGAPVPSIYGDSADEKLAITEPREQATVAP